MDPTKASDVIVVGAGPTGLLLAGDLAAAGVAVTLLDKRDKKSNLTRAFAVHARTLETLDIRGIADDLVATGSRESQLLLLTDAYIKLSNIDSKFPFVLITPQYNTENLLRERALAAGAVIEPGVEVVEVNANDDGVEVETVTAGGRRETRHASWVVGTDGVRSTVRRSMGLPFPGRLAVGSLVLADVKLAHPPKETVNANGVAEGFAFIAPFGTKPGDEGDGYYRVICRKAGDTTPDDVPADFEEIRYLVSKAFGTDFGMHEPRWMSRIHSDERQAPHYRVGRVLLAGDAAHVHSPAGGQGMNTGLQDAANLGWKLAAVVNGWAPDGLLDSYEAERHPVGRRVLRGSGTMLRMGLVRSNILRGLRNKLLGPTLRNRFVSRRVAGFISGVGVRYEAPEGAGETVGLRAGDLALATSDGGPTRLYEALRGGRFVLVTGEPQPKLPAELNGHVDVVAPATATTTATLVRPDGYIAWEGPVGQVPTWRYRVAAE